MYQGASFGCGGHLGCLCNTQQTNPETPHTPDHHSKAVVLLLLYHNKTIHHFCCAAVALYVNTAAAAVVGVAVCSCGTCGPRPRHQMRDNWASFHWSVREHSKRPDARHVMSCFCLLLRFEFIFIFLLLLYWPILTVLQQLLQSVLLLQTAFLPLVLYYSSTAVLGQRKRMVTFLLLYHVACTRNEIGLPPKTQQ